MNKHEQSWPFSNAGRRLQVRRSVMKQYRTAGKDRVERSGAETPELPSWNHLPPPYKALSKENQIESGISLVKDGTDSSKVSIVFVVI